MEQTPKLLIIFTNLSSFYEILWFILPDVLTYLFVNTTLIDTNTHEPTTHLHI